MIKDTALKDFQLHTVSKEIKYIVNNKLITYITYISEDVKDLESLGVTKSIFVRTIRRG